MTRNLAFALLSIGLLAVPARAGETLREQAERVLEARGVRQLRVENPRGVIRVRPGEPGRIRITALKIVRASGADRAREIAGETEVRVTTGSGRCEIGVIYPQRRHVRVGFWDMLSGEIDLPAIEVRLTLEVPSGLEVSLRSTSGDLYGDDLTATQQYDTTSGDITVSGAAGAVTASSTSGDLVVAECRALRLRTVSGDVSVRAAAGPVDAYTTSGDCTVRDAGDSVSVSTVSGDVRVERAPRSLRVSSTSGDVRARGAAGTVRIDTSSGDVNLDLVPPLRRVEVSTGSGDITARLGSEVGGEVELRTSRGRIDSTLPLEVKSVSRHVVTGRIRSGTAPVILRSSSGDIQLTGGGS